MKYLLSTIKKDSKIYVTGCVLISDTDAKDHEKRILVDTPVKGDLISQRGKYQYVLQDGKINLDPEIDSLEDKKKEHDKEKVNYIRSKYNANDEIKLLNQAVAALLNNEEVPDAYKEYRDFVNAFN